MKNRITNAFFLGAFFAPLLAFGAMPLSTHAQSGASGRVGVNTNVPQATLDVNGALRADSLRVDLLPECPPGTDSLWGVVCDSAGNFFKKPISPDDTGSPYPSFAYGDHISAGDLVCMGDGKSAYMCCNGDGPFASNEITSPTRMVAQGFRSTGASPAVRAVNMRIPITNGANHSFTFSVREIAAGGVPGAIVSQQTLSFVGTGNSTGWSLFVFDPPLATLPDTDYFLVIQASANASTRTIRTVSGGIATGVLGISSNNGGSWTLDPARDVEMHIYVVRSIPGRIYRSEAPWLAETLDPRQGTILATSGQSIVRDFYNKSHGVIGVAMEGGMPGHVGKVCIGPILPITHQVLVPGMAYYVDQALGRVALTVSASCLTAKIGFAVSEHYLMIDR